MHVAAWSDPPLAARIKLTGLTAANRLFNFPNPRHGPAVTIPMARAGGAGVLLSVLFDPYAELDLMRRYGARPRNRYFADLIAQLESVEREVAENWSGQAAIARSFGELEEIASSGRVAVVHAVEGGFHLGSAPAPAANAVTELARRGVAYITLAHLFYRAVATNANAVPFLTDRLYRWLFPQPDIGLTHLGQVALERMFEEGVLVDLTHMSHRAMAQTLDLYDAWDPKQKVPVLVTHVGTRLAEHDYNVPDEIVVRVARRGGVIGVLLARHLLRGRGLPKGRNFAESVDLICAHIDRIEELAGGCDSVGIGTDLDGYIRPVAGLETLASLAGLAAALHDRYGAEAAGKITGANAMRALGAAWGVKRSRAGTRRRPLAGGALN